MNICILETFLLVHVFCLACLACFTEFVCVLLRIPCSKTCRRMVQAVERMVRHWSLQHWNDMSLMAWRSSRRNGDASLRWVNCMGGDYLVFAVCKITLLYPHYQSPLSVGLIWLLFLGQFADDVLDVADLPNLLSSSLLDGSGFCHCLVTYGFGAFWSLYGLAPGLLGHWNHMIEQPVASWWSRLDACLQVDYCPLGCSAL